MSQITRPIVPSLSWYVTAADAGQMIEIAYSYTSSDVAMRRVTDRSTGEISYQIGEIDWANEGEMDRDRAPAVTAWRDCGAPRIEEE